MQGIDKSRSAPLNRGSGIPLHLQIQQRLLEQIQSGEFKSGAPMPSIEKIAQHMGVSQMTVRQAMRSLAGLGVIYSRQGKGTFISGIKLERDFRQVLSFTEEAVSHGARPSSKVLSFKIQKPSQKVKDALAGPGTDDRVYVLRRVRYENSSPMAIECSYLPVYLYPGLLEKFDPANSLYEELSAGYGIQLAVTDEVIEVGKASPADATLLEIAPQSPVFLFTRTSYLENGPAAEYVTSVYRGDRYKVVNRLMRMRRSIA